MNAAVDLFSDENLSRMKRDLGIAQAVEHAERVHDGWLDEAYEHLLDYIAVHDTPFMGEDIRAFATQRGLPAPPHLRAWGGVLTRAAKSGAIRKIGFSNVKDPNGHRGAATLWERAA